MRLYPDHIRSAIIDSALGPTHLWNIDYYLGRTEELERIFAGCAANAACNGAYPNIRKLFFRLIHRLQDHPVDIPIPTFPSGPNVFYLDGIGFYQDTLDSIFPGNAFEPDSIRPMLADIWRATHGQLVQLYQERFDFSGGPPPPNDTDTYYAQGKTISYACHDLIAFETRADFEQAARDLPELAPLFRDPNNWLPDGPAGCRIWDVGRAKSAQHQPVVSTIPTLVMAGEYDSVPPRTVRQIPLGLSRSFFYEFPAAFHLQLASYNQVSPCARAIAIQFLEEPTERPDADCIAALPRFDFTPNASELQTRQKMPLRNVDRSPIRLMERSFFH
jgi:pimeloyl-ACP methyl ester carboxylesterase